MAMVVLPIAALSVAIATVIYANSLQEIENQQIRVAQEFSGRTLIWFRSLSQYLLTEAAVMKSDSAEACARTSRAILDVNPSYRAIMFEFDGQNCLATDGSIDKTAVRRLFEAGEQEPKTTEFFGLSVPAARLRPVRDDKGWSIALNLHASHPAGSDPIKIFLLFSPSLQETMLSLTQFNNAFVALVDAQFNIIMGDATSISNRNLRKKIEEGKSAHYVFAPVVASNMRLIAYVDDAGRRAAWGLFLVLAITPLLLLAFVYLVYARSIQRDVMYWIYGIKSAALERALNPNSRSQARVGPEMPRELRRVAEAFNKMVSDIGAREEWLRAALNENERLTRELHHRVKNSLQVIQSYLSLSERLAQESSRNDFMETGARVQVLSIAYRIALADGKMQPVGIKSFSEEVIGSLSAASRKPPGWIKADYNVQADLVVDRAIPFGLAIVECVIACLHADQLNELAIRFVCDANKEISITIATDGQLRTGDPNPKIMRGLALQLEAIVGPCADGQILNWRFAT